MPKPSAGATSSEILAAQALVDAGQPVPCELARALLEALPARVPTMRWPQPDAEAEARSFVR